MKRVFFYFLLSLFLAAPAAYGEDWGLLEDFIKNPERRYAMDFFIDNKPIRYQAMPEITAEEKAVFVENFNKWRLTTKKAIEDSKRKKIFQDIMPLLDNPIVLEETDKDPDIILKVGDEFCRERAAGCFIWNTPFEIAVKQKYRKDFNQITLHEIGHYFGLGDQYARARYNSHENYSSDLNTKQGSVMEGAYILTCDDIDGFINVLDFRLAQRNGQFSERAQHGWVSVCQYSKNLYQESKTVNRNPTDVLMNPKEQTTVRIYEKGELKSWVNLPDVARIFAVEKESQVTRDPKTGLISSIMSSLGLIEHDTQHNSTYIETPGGATWKRTFKYLPKKESHGNIYIPIAIAEYINDIPMRKWEIRVFQNGDLTGSHAPIKIRNGKHTHTVQEKIMVNPAIRLVKTSNIEVDFVIENGKVKSFSSKETEPNLEKFCQPHIRYIESFYINFHRALFGPSEADLQEAQQTVKDIQTKLQKSIPGMKPPHK